MPTLVIVERSVDVAVARGYIDAIGGAEAYGEVAALSDSIGAELLTPVTAVGGRSGTADDEDLCRETDRLAADLCDSIGRALGHEREVAGLDTAEALRFVLSDAVLGLGRIIRPMARLIRSERYGAIVFLASTGRLVEGMLPVAEEAVDPRDVHVLWVPDVGGGARSASPPQATAPSGPGRDVTQPSAGHVAFLVEPRPRMTREFSRIVEEVAKRRQVAIVGSSDQLERHSGVSGHLRALANSNLGQVCLVAPDLDVPEAPSVAGMAINKVLSDPLIAELQLDGVKVRSMLYPVLRRALDLWREGRQFALGFDAYLRSLKPRVLVVCPDRTPNARLACQIARRHGVVSVYPIPGLISRSPRYKELQADYGCVMDDSQVRIQEAMYPGDRGRLFGDGLPELDHVAAAWRHPTFRSPRSGRRVALLLQPMPEAYNAQLIGLVQEAAAASGAALIVRPHPYELESSRQRFAALLDDGSASGLDNGTLVELLESADLAVGGYSTALIEAAILGVPVVAVNLTGTPFVLSLGAMGIATEVNDPDSLRTVVNTLLTDENAIASARCRQDEYFDRNPHLREGNAAKRIADRIERAAASDGGFVEPFGERSAEL